MEWPALLEQSLRFRFADKKLEALYTEEKGAHKYATGVGDAFFDAMAVIESAKDERDFYALKGWHYEQLKHDRKGQSSLRLNRQWRLILVIERDAEGNMVVVVEIVDYH